MDPITSTAATIGDNIVPVATSIPATSWITTLTANSTWNFIATLLQYVPTAAAPFLYYIAACKEKQLGESNLRSTILQTTKRVSSSDIVSFASSRTSDRVAQRCTRSHRGSNLRLLRLQIQCIRSSTGSTQPCEHDDCQASK